MIRFHIHGYGEFTRQQRIGPTMWPHFDLLFVHCGHLALTIQRKEKIELRSSESVLLYPQTTFEGSSLVDVTQASVIHFSVDAKSASPRPPFDRLRECRRGFQLHDGVSGRRAESDIHRAIKLSSLPPSALLTEMRIAALTLALAELSGEARENAWMDVGEAFEVIIAWATENLRHRPTVDDLAERAGLSSSHFRSRFRAETGVSAGTFLRDLRIREASRLLRETRLPLKRICSLAGYSDIASLYHAFHRHNGITPAQYRKRYALTV